MKTTENAAEALYLIAKWGRLRPRELGMLMFGTTAHSQKYAETYVKKLKELGLVIARKLPGGVKSGTAYVLSEKGAHHLARTKGPGWRSGKDWGTTAGGEWKPPGCWKHDLRAYGVLAHLHCMGYDVFPEKAVRGDDPRSEKHPDGLVINREQGVSVWLEVEGARKTGKRDMTPLVEALVSAARGTPKTHYDLTLGAPMKAAAVAIDPEARDEKGHRIDHWSRLVVAVKARGLKTPVSLFVIWVVADGVGVGSIRVELKTIQP
jgi:hypothetical protein